MPLFSFGLGYIYMDILRCGLIPISTALYTIYLDMIIGHKKRFKSDWMLTSSGVSSAAMYYVGSSYLPIESMLLV